MTKIQIDLSEEEDKIVEIYKLVNNLKTKQEAIKKMVKDKYSEVAANPCGVFNFPVGKAFALKVGYPKEILDKLPDSLTESFTGANNPQPFVELKEGEVVLDLGCGAGLDLYFYAKAVGDKGRAYGLDISVDMVNKARENMVKAGIENVEIHSGESDKMPFNDNFFDIPQLKYTKISSKLVYSKCE